MRQNGEDKGTYRYRGRRNSKSDVMEIKAQLVRASDVEALTITVYCRFCVVLVRCLTYEPRYKMVLKEFTTVEKVRGLLAATSTEQAQSSLLNTFSIVCPNTVEGILEEGMSLVTNCSGLIEYVDHQSKVKSAHALLLSLGCFDDVFEALPTLLHKVAYRCHVKFGADMPSHII
ncbi:hypothetical protein KIW84_035176 [Lathyrus oleraceus]|uniref:Uncharacterized protein n=1 Tax=Pisum sativum TaxID=3888 RepID=A0A9D4Y0Q0_PEA|nr:hypothetical protein KIW84_035176 [Pisum sativum]